MSSIPVVKDPGIHTMVVSVESVVVGECAGYSIGESAEKVSGDRGLEAITGG